MVKAVALVTPSHRGDVERFALLCDSIDRFVRGYERHYIIVNGEDVPFFARLMVVVESCCRAHNSCRAGLGSCRHFFRAVDA